MSAEFTLCEHPDLPGQTATIATEALDGWRKLGWEPVGESLTVAQAQDAAVRAEVEVQEIAAEVPDLTIAQVLEEVGDDPEKAQAALDAELARPDPRVTLVARLTTKAGQTGDPEGN